MTVTDCGASFTKGFLSFLNFIFFVSSAFLLALGVWLLAHKDSFISLTELGLEKAHDKIPRQVSRTVAELSQPSTLEQLALAFTVFGGGVFLLSVFGYCGARKESRCCLVMYSFFVSVIVVLQVSFLTLTATWKSEVERQIKNFLHFSLDKFYALDSEDDGGLSAVALSWNFVMAEMRCCGIDNYTDFQRSSAFRDSKVTIHQVVPPACCILDYSKYPPFVVPEDDHCLTNPTSYNSYLYKGCYSKLTDSILSNLDFFLISIVSVLALEVVVILFALCLCKAIEKDLKQFK